MHNAWQRYWQHIAGTTWRPTGPNAPSFATTSCVAHALLACPGFLVSDLYVRHATCTWCRYRPRRETYGTRACVHVQNQNSLDLVQNVVVATFTHGAAMPEGKWKGDTALFFLVLQRVPCIFSGGGLFLGITVTSPVRWHALCCNGFTSVFGPNFGLSRTSEPVAT